MALTIENRDGVLYAKGTVGSKRINRSLNLPAGSMKAAKLAIKEIEAKAVASSENTFAEIADAYLNWKEMEGKDTWRSPDFKYRVPQLIAALGKLRPSEIDVPAFVRKSMAGKAAGSMKKMCNILKAILKFGQDHGMAEELPTFPKIKVHDARDESFTPSQVKEFLEYVRANHPDMELAAAILVDAGLRVGELCRLTTHDLDGDNVTVKSKAHGKAKLRTIPQSSRIKDAIGRAALPRGKVFDMTPNSMSKKMAVILEGCCKQMGIERLRVHDLRHTFARQCGEAGVDLAELQHLMGHSTIAMTVRYRGFLKSRATSVIANF